MCSLKKKCRLCGIMGCYRIFKTYWGKSEDARDELRWLGVGSNSDVSVCVHFFFKCRLCGVMGCCQIFKTYWGTSEMVFDRVVWKCVKTV